MERTNKDRQKIVEKIIKRLLVEEVEERQNILHQYDLADQIKWIQDKIGFVRTFSLIEEAILEELSGERSEDKND